MGAALIGLTLGVAVGAALLYLGGRLRGQGKIAKVFGFFVSMYGAIMIAVSLYALLTLK